MSEDKIINIENRAMAYYSRGNNQAKLGNYQSAIEDYNKAIKLGEDGARIYCSRGYCKRKLNDYEGAIKDYDAAIELDESFAKAYYNRSNCKLIFGDREGAIKDYDKAIELDERYAQDHYRMSKFISGGYQNSQKTTLRGAITKGIIKFKQHVGESKAASYYFNGLAKIRSPEDSSLFKNSFTPDYKGAIKYFDKAIESNKNFANAYYHRGVSKAKLGKHAEAIKDFNKAIILSKNLSVIYHNKDSGRLSSVDYEGTTKQHNKAMKLDENYTSLYYNNGEAIVGYNKLDNICSAYSHRGISKYELGNYRGAIADYNKVIKINKENMGCYKSRGIFKYKLGDYEGAIADYTKVIELIQYYMMLCAQFPGGLFCLEALVRTDPNNDATTQLMALYNDRGVCKHKLGDPEGAIADYTKAIELDKDCAMAYYNRSLCKHELKDYEGAKKDYDKAIELDNDLY